MSINWTNHRVMFNQFVRANHGLIWLNLLYLMVGVAFIPVPTAVPGEWLGNPQNEAVAAVFYGAAGCLGALLSPVGGNRYTASKSVKALAMPRPLRRRLASSAPASR